MFTDGHKRYWSKVEKTDGCWIWHGAHNALGYGTYWIDGVRRITSPHRFGYELAHGPIPPGLHVCHRCDNPRCVNPEHLFLGTARDNLRDMVAKDRHNPRGFRDQTHCKRGHPFNEVNTRINHLKNGRTQRHCRACKRERYRAERASVTTSP